MKEMEKKNAILEKSFAFALLIIEYAEELESQKKYVLSRQLLRSGTSIGANIREAQSCESRADFIHKLKIATKEADETEYWLLLCKHSKSYPNNDSLLPILNEMQKLLSSIISTSKKNI
jgi:four helix bundle protein